MRALQEKYYNENGDISKKLDAEANRNIDL